VGLRKKCVKCGSKKLDIYPLGEYFVVCCLKCGFEERVSV
jgi:predicted nucleic-acid-binding Zn-ribbon protein